MTVTTSYTYATPKDIENFLMLNGVTFSTTSTPKKAVIEQLINQAEGEFEARTGQAYRPILVTNEIHDVEAWRTRFNEYLNNDWVSPLRPFQLHNKPLIPFSSSRGHKIEMYEGSQTAATSSNPIGEWSTEFIADKTYGRANDWWYDENGGVVYIRKAFLFRRNALLRFTYEYGKPITALNGAITSSDTTITVDSTHRYQTRGWIRIGDEYIYHSGKTETTFTGCTRAIFNSSAAAHSDDDEVIELPDHVRDLVIKRVAAMFLMNEQFMAVAGDGSPMMVNHADKIQLWNQEWENGLNKTYQKWGLL